MTPQEMADWLETFFRRDAARFGPTPAQANARLIADYLRAQPTDAQKMEALEFAGEAGFITAICVKPRDAAMHLSIEDGAHCAREALRLLGLPTGDDTP